MSDHHPKTFVIQMDGTMNGTKVLLKNEHNEIEDLSNLLNSVTIEQRAGETPVLIMQVLDPQLELLAEIDGAQTVLVYPVDPSTVDAGDPALMDTTRFE